MYPKYNHQPSFDINKLFNIYDDIEKNNDIILNNAAINLLDIIKNYNTSKNQLNIEKIINQQKLNNSTIDKNMKLTIDTTTPIPILRLTTESSQLKLVKVDNENCNQTLNNNDKINSSTNNRINVKFNVSFDATVYTNNSKLNNFPKLHLSRKFKRNQINNHTTNKNENKKSINNVKNNDYNNFKDNSNTKIMEIDRNRNVNDDRMKRGIVFSLLPTILSSIPDFNIR